MRAHRYHLTVLGALLPTLACGGELPTEAQRDFLDGTADDSQIGLVVNSLERSITLFQLGDHTEVRQIPLGESSQITPVSQSIRGRRAAVPLGNAASVALVSLEELRIERFFVFPSGNATGSAFVDDNTLLATNLVDDLVGLIEVDQADDAIVQTLPVAPAPAAIVVTGNRAFVVSSNLDENFAPIGNGIVTVIDLALFEIAGSIEMGGTNSQSAALGPDNLLYVLNTGDFVAPGSITIVDPVSLQVVDEIPDVGVGPGTVYIASGGLAYVSGFFLGTVVFDTATREFVRGPEDPVCVRFDGGCLAVFDAETDASGDLYQVFFGSPSQDLPPFAYVFDAETFELADSVSVGMGASSIDIRSFPTANLGRARPLGGT